MKILRLVVLIVCCGLGVTLGYSQNCPPDSAYPNPQIASSFAPDSSCLDSVQHPGSGTDPKRDCLGACEHSYTTYCTMSVPGHTYLWNVVGGTIVGSSTSNCVTVFWGPAGPGTIKVTETSGAGCTASKEQCVKIINSPIAAFTVSANVCKNVPLNFVNTSQNAISYLWNFGEPSSGVLNTSTLTNPTHTYTVPGPHTVTLVAYNKCGCKDSATFVVNVSNLDGPVITCPATVCASAEACYSTPSGCSTAVYTWIVNGGTIIGPSNQNNICVQWGSGPQGTISLFITGCSSVCPDTTTVIVPIISTNGPISGNATACPSSNEIYTLPLWPGTYYTWTLSGGGTIISGMNTNALTIHWGLAPGTYTLTATWNNILLGCHGTATIIINVKDVFQMFGQPGPFCIGSTSNFFANNNANWTVTGGTFTGNGTNAIAVTWTTSGTQTVTAVPVNPSLYCNPSVSMTVTVNFVPPAVSISGPAVICTGSTYQYTATPSGAGYGLLWTITGGTIVGSPTANPVTVQWTGAGTISVQQTATSPPFCASAAISLPVTVLSIPNITGPGNVCMDQTTSYSAGGPNPGIIYTWSIVDGLGNPSPLGSITTGQGTNAISVLWHGPGGSVKIKLSVCSQSLQLPVTINPKPTAGISMTGKVCNPGGQVVLTASGGGTYSWNTGANTSTLLVNTPGPYWVAVTNASGCTDTARITVPVSPGPVASISTPNATNYCTPPAPTIIDTLYALQGPGYTYVWSPGNQNTPTIVVNATGSYYVVVTDANGCSSTSNIITITAGPCPPGGCTPVGSISFTITTPICNPVQFNGSSSGGITGQNWNFGDPLSGGSNTSALTNPTHLFTAAGWYTVTYSGVDPNSCPISTSQAVPIPLAADFSFAGQCGSIQFTDHSTFLPPNSITSWSWSFPGGSPSSSTSQNPSTSYSTSGPHSVTLTVSNGTCTVSITKTVTVPPFPSAAFVLPSSACAGTDITMSGSGGSAVSWLWNFGDGATSGLQNTSHAWTTAGTYIVKLVVKDANGCADS
ncbi:MAG: PKD domain-containing protein, partial [Ignavibacteria bacterium]